MALMGNKRINIYILKLLCLLGDLDIWISSIRPHLHKRGAIVSTVYHVRERHFISTWCKHPICLQKSNIFRGFKEIFHVFFFVVFQASRGKKLREKRSKNSRKNSQGPVSWMLNILLLFVTPPIDELNYCALHHIQGVRGQSVFLNWALTESNIQVRFYLKVVLKS